MIRAVAAVALAALLAGCGSSPPVPTLGSGSPAPSRSFASPSPSPAGSPTPRATVPVDVGTGIDRACTLLNANAVTAALGKPAGAAYANGGTTVGTPSGSLGQTSECLVSAADGSYTITVDDETYELLGDALARWSQVDQTGFDQLSLADGGYIQQPDVLLGVRSGLEIGFVSVSPRPTDAQFTALGQALVTGLSHPAPTAVPAPAAGDPDPCAYQQSVPLPNGHPLTKVTRTEADPPYRWACVYQYGDTDPSFKVEMTTSDQLSAAGVASPDALLQSVSAASSIDPAIAAPELVVSGDGKDYSNLASVPDGVPAIGFVGGPDAVGMVFPDPVATALKQWDLLAKIEQRKDCLEELEFDHKAQRAIALVGGGFTPGFGDPFLALALTMDDPDRLQEDCDMLEYEIDKAQTESN